MMIYYYGGTKAGVDKFFQEYCELDLERDWYRFADGQIFYKNKNVELVITYIHCVGAHCFELSYANAMLTVAGKFLLEDEYSSYIP